jgi:hypothetical protein
MPFRLTNAPAIYQALINNTLRDCLDNYAIVYLDNILIYSANKKEYIQYIKEVLQRLKDYNLELKPKKYKFYREEVEFLGYIVGKNRVRISETKIKTIKE